jgi:hypothetical protein
LLLAGYSDVTLLLMHSSPLTSAQLSDRRLDRS